jgi:hypothetical protein
MLGPKDGLRGVDAAQLFVVAGFADGVENLLILRALDVGAIDSLAALIFGFVCVKWGFRLIDWCILAYLAVWAWIRSSTSSPVNPPSTEASANHHAVLGKFRCEYPARERRVELIEADGLQLSWTRLPSSVCASESRSS